MVKVIILVINNTPQKTFRIAQYTDSWNRFHSLDTRGSIGFELARVGEREDKGGV